MDLEGKIIFEGLWINGKRLTLRQWYIFLYYFIIPYRSILICKFTKNYNFISYSRMQKGKTLEKLENSVRMRTKDKLHLLTLLKNRADHSILTSQSVDHNPGNST